MKRPTSLWRAAIVGLVVATGVGTAAPPTVAASHTVASDGAVAAKKTFDEATRLATDKKYEDAIGRYRKAADLYKSAGDAAGQLEALRRAGSLYQYSLKQNEKALELYTSALVIARASSDKVLVAKTLYDVAIAQRLLGHEAETVAAFEEALSIYETAADYQAVVSTLSNLGGVYAEFGDATKAEAYRARARQVRVEHNVPPGSMRVSGGVLAGKAKHREMAVYPPEAGKAGVHGTVVVEVTVAADGTVEKTRAVSGPAELLQAGIDAAQKWTFETTQIQGEPVRLIGTITFNFK